MPLPHEFVEFYKSWTEKADGYTGQTARTFFDRFLTQYVLYNRLYCEATLRLSRMPNSGIQIEGRANFPDAAAAKDYVAQFLGARHLIAALEGDPECVVAIAEAKRILEEHQFFIMLHPVTGERQAGEDEQLLDRLNAAGQGERIAAILEFIYCVRCNMIHGQKDFTDIQIVLLQPTTKLLQKVCELLYRKLLEHDN